MYIKLDKKLIVQIEEIELPTTTSSENSINDVKKHIQHVPFLLTVFQKINIESLKVKNNEFTIAIDDEIFYIDNKFINLSAKPVISEDVVVLNLYSLFLKDYNILFDGLLKANLQTDDMLFSGRLIYKDLDIELKAQTNEDVIDFVIKSNNELKNIHYVKDFIDLHETIEEWMYKNVTGDMKLEYLQGQLDRQTFIPIISSLDGVALIKNGEINFNNAVQKVKTKEIKVSFKNDNLYFDLENPMYNNISINGSNVVIYALSSENEKSNIIINLKTQSRLNKDILAILKAYEIELPIVQLTGGTQSQLAIQIYFEDNSLITKGVFEAENSRFSLNGFEFTANNAVVELNNNNVSIKNSNVTVDNFLNANLNLDINTDTSLATGNAFIHTLNIKSNETDIIKLNKFQTNVLLDYTNFTKINLPQLFTEISVLEEYTNIDITNLGFINNHSALLQNLKIYDGSLNLHLFDKNTIDFTAALTEFDFPILTKEGKKLEHLSVYGNIKNDNVFVGSSDERIQVQIENDKNHLFLKEFDIIKENNDLVNENSTLNLEIMGINSTILLNEKQKILADNYVLVLNKNTLNLELSYKDGIFNYNKDLQNNIKLTASNMPDKFINYLMGDEKFFNDGNFNLMITGSNNVLTGRMDTQNTKIKDLALINNLITFVNTTPALINPLLAIPTLIGMANNKGFNLTGYKIVEGHLDFIYDLNQELFYMENLQTIGNMTDFKAFGLLDLNKNEINADVTLIFLKDYSKIIDYVPVLNYLFLGDEKNISTQLKITGYLNDPIVQTNFTQDAAGAPVNFIKRIFNLPAKGIEMMTPKE